MAAILVRPRRGWIAGGDFTLYTPEGEVHALKGDLLVLESIESEMEVTSYDYRNGQLTKKMLRIERWATTVFCGPFPIRR